MTPVRIEVLKGMDSSVVGGLGDSPVSLVNVVHTRDGGYKPRPGKALMLTGVLAFRQFAVTRYAYVQTPDGSYLYDLLTDGMTAYPTMTAKRDVVVYADKVVVSGVETTDSFVPKFGAESLDSFVDESDAPVIAPETIPGPADGIYSKVVTQALTLSGNLIPVIHDIRLSVSLVPPGTGAFVGATPTAYDGPWVHTSAYHPFTSGGVQMVLVCFRLKPSFYAGDSMNPGEARPTYLQDQFLVALPDQPQKDDGTPLYGPYFPVFSFTGIPADYEPIFYTSLTSKGGQGYGLRNIPYYAAGASVSQWQAVRMITPNLRQTIWYKQDAGGVTLPATIPAGMDADDPPQASTVTVGTSTFVFAGYALDYSVYNDTAPYMSYAQMYQNMTGRNQMGAPIHLMADYINSANPSTVTSYNPNYKWTRARVNEATPGSYTLIYYPDTSDEEPPLFSTFFPVGSRSAFSSARTWVAADYSVVTVHDPATITDRHKAQIVTRAKRSYASVGPRTVFYSEPNSLEFNEQFIVPPFRKSRMVTALASTSAGVMVFGEADAVLISGDSLASFRASAIDIPGATSQATVAQWRGATFYANSSGMYMLSDGGGSKAISNPVAREWGVPVGVSLNDEAGSLLVSFGDGKTALHYDIQRDAWSKWTEEHTAIPTSSKYLMVAGGSPVLISKLSNVGTSASAEFVVDGGGTDIRKHWDRISYRKSPSTTLATISVRASNKAAWKTASTNSSEEDTVMVHRVNEHSTSLRVKMEFTGDTVIGGPLTINVKTVREETSIKD